MSYKKQKVILLLFIITAMSFYWYGCSRESEEKGVKHRQETGQFEKIYDFSDNLGSAEIIKEKAEKSVNKVDYKCPDCNVILISIDTLRADHLGCYGYHKNTTPNIDRFSKDSVLFKTCVAQAPSTLVSHASIFTSLIPSHHGAIFIKTAIPQEVVTIAEILKDYGYKTISYNSGGRVASEYGFDQGFDLYHSSGGRLSKFERILKRISKRIFFLYHSSHGGLTKKVNFAINWINNNPDRKFFLFLHTYEVHHPYTPKKDYLDLFEKNYSGKLPKNISGKLLNEINNGEIKINKEDQEHIINTYDAEIRSMDDGFLLLENFLREREIYDDTIIIFTSDHGEEFGEHGQMGRHSHSLYDELLLVPLIIKLPNSKYASKVVDEQVRSIDILPTLLDILDIRGLKTSEGVSLIDLVTGKTLDPLFAVSQQDGKRKNRPTSIRTKKWKLYGSKLFNLESDPLENNDVANENKAVKDFLRFKLNNILKQRKIPSTNKVKLDETTKEELKALGYIE